ncbi:MAG: TonB family protein [Proteobacteria bacterium]|nr:TonB family protein [Pseudomonadota bacterium]
MSQGNVQVPITFHFYEGDRCVRSETLAQDIIKIGRLESSHLRIEDDNVSKMHSVIEVSAPDDVYIIDLGSAAGTIVNGAKVNKAPLRHGDQILLGGTWIVVDMSQAQAADAVAPSAAVAGTASGASAAGGSPGAQPGTYGSMEQSMGAGDPSGYTQPAYGAGYAPEIPPGVSEGEVAQYQLVASEPPVAPEDIDSGEQILEIVVMWGELSVLHVAHQPPSQPFSVGDATDAKGKLQTDFLVGSESLGTERLPVTTSAGAVVIPPGAVGDVTIGDDEYYAFEELAATGRLSPCPELEGAQQFQLPANSLARVMYNGFQFVVKPVSAARPIGVGGRGIEWKRYLWTMLSLLLHGAFLLLFYFLPPYASSLSLDLLNADSRLVKYLIEPPETLEEETPEWLKDNKDDEGGKGKKHKDEQGQMGKKEEKKTKDKYAIEGPQDNKDLKMAREEAKEEARNAGIIGVLKMVSGAWNSPTSPYGAETALGADPMAALGALMGDQIGQNFGFGGLGVRGTGRGGGGTGEGTIGLGSVGTIGHGAGGGKGSGYGRGAGGFRGRRAKVPRIRTGRADVRGSLSKEVIRRIIRRHINEVRFCYEQELNMRPDLKGRVAVKFIISPTGAVQSAVVAKSSLGNARAENCIAKAVRRWTFPAPEGGGIVVVTYPFVLQQVGG